MKFDSLLTQISNAIPDNLEELREGLDKNVKTATQAALGKMDLVTREEFDIQCKLLTRSRQRLEDLSQQLDEIEKKLDKLQQ